MKKLLSLMISILIISALLSGCGAEESKASAETPLPPVTDSPTPSETGPYPAPNVPVEPKESSKSNGGDTGVDVDLTVLSSTMVYGEVFNIVMYPESYVGKTIKTRGLYYADYYEPTEHYYHFVIIQDATACCAQGLEFIWFGEHIYPDDYPENEAEIEITGVWESYEEEGQIWYRIKTDAIGAL